MRLVLTSDSECSRCGGRGYVQASDLFAPRGICDCVLPAEPDGFEMELDPDLLAEIERDE